jgi:demethylmenaquinone methyltransferase/2-methoxy-6-polyprenyl-1,4-benzoquinol methylase
VLTRSRTEPKAFAQELFGGLAPRYNLLGYLLSFGQDRRWRREMLRHVQVGRAATVLDVATGPGGVALALRRSTGATVVGVDITAGMLKRARENLSLAGENGVVLVQARGEELPFRDCSFDGLTFTYLLRYVSDVPATINELARVVRPEGPISSLEFHVPDHRVARLAWMLYTRLVLPIAGRLLGGADWQRVGQFLGPSISEHYSRHPVGLLVTYWRKAGIDGVSSRRMSLGGGIVIWGTKRAQRAP